MVLIALYAITPSVDAADILVSSRFSDAVLRYDGQTGAFVEVFASGNGLDNPNGLAYGPDGNLYVGQGDDGSVLRFNGQTGDFIDTFIPSGHGGLGGVRDMAFGPDGNLYVASGTTDQILAFDGADGAPIGVAAQAAGLDGPVGLAFGPTGRLYVAAALSNLVYEFDNGTLLRTLNCGAGHSNAVGLAFDPLGRLYVSQSVTNEVLRFDLDSETCEPFSTGDLLRTPIYMTALDDGDFLVGSFSNDRVVRINGETGAESVFVTRGLGGLDGTHDIVVMPVPEPSSALLLLMAVQIARIRCRRTAVIQKRTTPRQTSPDQKPPRHPPSPPIQPASPVCRADRGFPP